MTTPRSSMFSGILPHFMAILVAAAGCVGVAYWAKDIIEAVSLGEIDLALGQAGHNWTTVTVDGLTVELSGTAPDEATRFAALSTAGSVVDASRIVDRMDVRAAAAIEAPDFAIEILKNSDSVSVIGLVPLISDPETIVQSVRAVSPDTEVAGLLEIADFPVPDGWDAALSFGIEVLDKLPRSKITVTPGRLLIKTVADSPEDQQRLVRQLERDAPRGVALELDISAPRPVVAPFTLRAVADGNGARFDACTADSEAALAAIQKAANSIGIDSTANCILGLGTPSTSWGEAAAASLTALGEIGGGTITLSNADITFVVPEGTAENVFDRVAGDLEAALPEVFSLQAILPKPEASADTGDKAPPEFVATRSPEGQVQIRGRISDETMRSAVVSFAAAQFGAENVYSAARLDADVPKGWPKRVMAALSALGRLHNGAATVTVDKIEVRGATGDQTAKAEIARLLSAALGGAASYDLDVTYREALDPLAALPTPAECIEQLNVAASERKITFAPSSSDIEADAQDTIDKISDILRQCQDIEIEIGGHTDSQGRETMNEQLSQARADAVLNAIMARRILVSNLSAKGYGESQPIADNGTEAGREANRRIEFKLLAANEEDQQTTEAEPEAAEEEAEGTSE